jgi:hypothetical protein
MRMRLAPVVHGCGAPCTGPANVGALERKCRPPDRAQSADMGISATGRKGGHFTSRFIILVSSHAGKENGTYKIHLHLFRPPRASALKRLHPAKHSLNNDAYDRDRIVSPHKVARGSTTWVM